LVVAQLRSAEAAYDEARRQRDEAVIEMARVDGLSNREIAARVKLTQSAWRRSGYRTSRKIAAAA
jgi:DNA-directed RNA polymerase specialized sigma24 family protein